MITFETSWFDKNDFRYYERVSENRKSFKRQINNKYEYFVENQNGEYKTLIDDIAVERKLGTAKEAKDHFGITTPVYLSIRENHWEKNDYNSEPRIWYLDIETRALGEIDANKAEYPVTLIQILDTYANSFIVLGLREWKPDKDYKLDYNVKYILCKDEKILLNTFLAIFKKLDPFYIYAWNGANFDFPYLYNRMIKLKITPALSNYGNVECYTNRKGENIFKSQGHAFLDLMDIYKKFVSSPRQSYSLDSISKIELNANKVEHTEFDDFDSFYTGEKYTISEEPYKEKYREKIRQGMIKRSQLDKNSDEYKQNEKELLYNINFQFVYYGLIDVALLKGIDEKLSLTKELIMISQMMGILPTDATGTLKPWGQYLTNYALKDKKVMPKRIETSDFDINFLSFNTQEKIKEYLKENDIPYSQKLSKGIFSKDEKLLEQVETELMLIGGYVMEPVKGKHKYVVNFDVNSMYPLLSMATFNMSPEKYIPQEKLPQDLRVIVNKYFSGQIDNDKLNIPTEIMQKTSELLKKYNLSMAINGACFKRDSQGIIPKLVTEIYASRKKDKKSMQKYEAQKVLINKILKDRENA